MKESDDPPWGYFLAIGGLLAIAVGLRVLPGLLTTPAQSPIQTPAPTPATIVRVTPSETPVEVCRLIGAGSLHSVAKITGLAFPAGLTVTAGDQMTFLNLDSRVHSVTLDGGACDTGSIVAGASATLKFSVPGTYPFHCLIYPGMKGDIVVTPP